MLPGSNCKQEGWGSFPLGVFFWNFMSLGRVLKFWGEGCGVDFVISMDFGLVAGDWFLFEGGFRCSEASL